MNETDNIICDHNCNEHRREIVRDTFWFYAFIILILLTFFVCCCLFMFIWYRVNKLKYMMTIDQTMPQPVITKKIKKKRKPETESDTESIPSTPPGRDSPIPMKVLSPISAPSPVSPLSQFIPVSNAGKTMNRFNPSNPSHTINIHYHANQHERKQTSRLLSPENID